MNDKEKRIYEILDAVVSCCTMEINGKPTLSAEDVLGKNKNENVNMTRCIFVTEMLFAGYSTTTTALLLHRTEASIRNILNAAHRYRISSKAYRLAEAEATIKCKALNE